MCGIFGHSFQRKAKVPAGQREILIASLCVANSYRGAQSWGIYAAGQKGRKARTRREVGDLANVDSLGSLAAWPVVFGHTRHATTGAVTRENQHPFRVGTVLLAHNGMVWNHDDLNRKYGRKCVVDSQHFAHHVNSGLTFSDIEAYGSLEWVEDKSPTTVFLCRMTGGVLSVAGIKNRKGKQVGTAWSSDKDHLKRALEASRLDWFWYETPVEGQVYEVSNGKLFTSRRPALRLAETTVDQRAMRRAQRLTSGIVDTRDGWWDRHYPRRNSYTWDSRSGSVVSTGHNYLDTDGGTRLPDLTVRENRPAHLSVVGVADDGKLSDDGAGAPAHRDDEEAADYDAEAQRLGLIKLDDGMWSVPETGDLVDREGIDTMLDQEEDDEMEAEFRDLTQSETFANMADAEEEAWKTALAGLGTLED